MQAIEQSEKLYRTVVEYQTELICRFLSDWRLEFVNDAFCRYFGRKAGELIGQGFMKFILAEDRQNFEKHLASLSRKNPTATIHLRVRKPGGGTGLLQLVICAIINSQGQIKEYQSVGRDMSEQELAPQKIIENERLFRNVFDTIQDGISVLDKDLNILWANATLEKWYSGSGSSKGGKCHIVYHGRKTPCQNCPGTKALETGRPAREILPRVDSRKTVGWFESVYYPLLNSSGKPNGLIRQVRDLTDRVGAEKELSEKARQFRLLVDCTYNWEYWLGIDGNYLYVSPSCKRISGYSADEFIKDAGLFERIIHPNERQLVAQHIGNAQKSRDTTTIEFRIITADDNVCWINQICQPVYDEKGQYIGLRGTNQDISKRMKAIQALHQAKENLEHQVQERTALLDAANIELKSKQKELISQKAKLEKVNEELMETNRAISVLAKNIDKSRQVTENTLAEIINSKIMPTIASLRKSNKLKSMNDDLDILVANVQALAGDLTGGMNLMAALTPTELSIGAMIKNGLTSQQISEKLFVSLHTVKTHRRNIRKKLNLQNSRINLTSYLQSVMR
jgi:PAS domain S-box-containing protein